MVILEVSRRFTSSSLSSQLKIKIEQRIRDKWTIGNGRNNRGIRKIGRSIVRTGDMGRYRRVWLLTSRGVMRVRFSNIRENKNIIRM